MNPASRAEPRTTTARVRSVDAGGAMDWLTPVDSTTVRARIPSAAAFPEPSAQLHCDRWTGPDPGWSPAWSTPTASFRPSSRASGSVARARPGGPPDGHGRRRTAGKPPAVFRRGVQALTRRAPRRWKGRTPGTGHRAGTADGLSRVADRRLRIVRGVESRTARAPARDGPGRCRGCPQGGAPRRCPRAPHPAASPVRPRTRRPPACGRSRGAACPVGGPCWAADPVRVCRSGAVRGGGSDREGRGLGVFGGVLVRGGGQ